MAAASFDVVNDLERTFDLTKILLSYKLDLSLSQLINHNNVNIENKIVQNYIDERMYLIFYYSFRYFNYLLNSFTKVEFK
jgi:hypothetical protein